MATNKQKRKSAPASTDAPEVTKRHRDNEQGHYTTLPDLTQQHYAMLKASAISDNVIKERGYRTITNAKEIYRHLDFLLPRSAPLGFSCHCIQRMDKHRFMSTVLITRG